MCSHQLTEEETVSQMARSLRSLTRVTVANAKRVLTDAGYLPIDVTKHVDAAVYTELARRKVCPPRNQITDIAEAAREVNAA